MNSIELFLQSVCRFVSTEERARDIRDELQDHISNYIEEYMNKGMSLDEATNEALKQMGDPNMLSELYKEKPYKYKGFLKVFLITVLTFISIFSKAVYDKLNNSNIIFSCTVLLIFALLYIYFISQEIKVHKKKVNFSKEEPIFLIQNYKGVFFCGGNIKISIMYLLVFASFFNLILDMSISVPKDHVFLGLLKISYLSNNLMIIFIILTTIYGQYKLDKSIVYTDGILALNKFIPWSNIQGYRWDKLNKKGKGYYLLEIKVKGKILSRRAIKVSSFQVNLIEELFISKNIEKKIHF